MAESSEPTYTPWHLIHEPMGCDVCGVLVSASTVEAHTAHHVAVTKLGDKLDKVLSALGKLASL